MTRWNHRRCATLLGVLLVPVTPVVAAPPGSDGQSVPVKAAEPWPQTVPDASRAATEDARCVDALFQLQVLAGDWKVYKAGPAGVRTYLADRDRPAEIQRLTRERDASCGDDPTVRAAQQRRASELFQAMSPDCMEAREKLHNLERPTARSAPSDIENQRAWIEAHCPGVTRDGVWIADWRYPPRAR